MPIRGAGYRGRFGGEGWDGMRLDMSEIVRPIGTASTAEFISTAVDIGLKPPRVLPDGDGKNPRVVVALAEAIIGEVPEPASDLPWRAQLEAFATDCRRVLQSHRDAARIMIVAQPAALRLYERLVRSRLAAGFDGGLAVEACHLLAGTDVQAAVAEEWGMGAAQDAEHGEVGAPPRRACASRGTHRSSRWWLAI